MKTKAPIFILIFAIALIRVSSFEFNPLNIVWSLHIIIGRLPATNIRDSFNSLLTLSSPFLKAFEASLKSLTASCASCVSSSLSAAPVYSILTIYTAAGNTDLKPLRCTGSQ